MSIKKTWFSYILWLMATGFSICYLVLNVGSLAYSLGIYGTSDVWSKALYGVGFLLIVTALCIGVCVLRQKISLPRIPKWIGRGLHILILFLMVLWFVGTRISAVYTAVYDSQTVMNLYESSKIGGNATIIQTPASFLDQLYANLLSGVFLFLGNKVEVMLYVQIFLQSCSFLLLMFIGFKMLKGFCVWIPAAGYAFSPLFTDTAADMGAANFWFFLVVCLLGVFCLLERFLWKENKITYMSINGLGLLAGVAFFFVKINSFVFKSYFLLPTGGATSVSIPDYFIGAVVLSVFMLLYCVTFFFSNRERASLCIVPACLYMGLLFLVQMGDLEVESFLLMLIHLYLYFVVGEGLLMLYEPKSAKAMTSEGPEWEEFSRTEVSMRDTAIINEIKSGAKEMPPQESVEVKETLKKETKEVKELSIQEKTEENSKPSNFEWWEKDKKMEDINKVTEEIISPVLPPVTEMLSDEYDEEEPVLIKVSDIVKDSLPSDTETFALASQTEETTDDIKAIDKTAMIENVLPMPKKHVNRTLDYAFEPSADMMCYDIEVPDDDDYDYPVD